MTYFRKSFTVKVLAIFGTILFLMTTLKSDIINIAVIGFGCDDNSADSYYQLALSSIIVLKTVLGIKGRIDTEKKPNIKDR
jgi:hypothetical protein